MRATSSRGKSPQTTMTYETYEMQRLREIGEQRAVLENELLLLYRTCENIALWNLGSVGGFRRYVLVVGFRYDHTDYVARSLRHMRYVYDGEGPKLSLSSYACSHAEVTLQTLERGVPQEVIEVEPLMEEMRNVQREVRALDAMARDLQAYAPGGVKYRRLLRRAAQNGMTRYAYRRRVQKPARYC